MPKEPVSPGITNLAEQIREKYYTAKEAQERLGMTRDAFNYYVKQGIIKKETIVGGLQHGYYAKEQIERLILQIEAALLTADTPELEYRFATEQDIDAENMLAYLNFGPRARAPEISAARRLFLERNPMMTHHLSNHGSLVASLNLLPLTHAAILEFREGKRGWHFDLSQIEQFEPGRPLECIIIDFMTTTLVSPDRRKMYAEHLLKRVAYTLKAWGQQGITIVSIDACGGSLDGRRILESAGFANRGEHHGRMMYHLDVEQSDLKMLLPYKLALRTYYEHQSS